jgi:hypothetical protein
VTLSTHLRRLITLTLLTMFMLMLHACGNSRLTTHDEKPDPAVSDNNEYNFSENVEEFSAALSESTCQTLFECCSASELEGWDHFNTESVEQCSRQSTLVAFIFKLDKFDASLAAGRLEYDPDAAEKCAADLASLDCTELTGNLSLATASDDCRSTFIPQVAAGEGCEIDQDCVTGYCGPSDGPLVWACATPPGLGDPCPEGDCAGNSYCKPDNATCTEKKANGESCSHPDDCASASCALNSAQEQVCQPLEPLCSGD